MSVAHARKTESARLPGLDALRSLAILAVMLFHLNGFLPDSFQVVGQFGWMGVDLFFVLSGYLIGSQLLKLYRRNGRLSLVDFYRRRAFRILPAYLLVLLLYFAVPAWRESPGISSPWLFLTFTQNFFIDYSVHQAFSFAWSLCVEEHFYLLLPLLVILLGPRLSIAKTIALLLFLVAMGMGIRAYVLFHILRPLGEDNFQVAYLQDIYYPTYTRLDGFLTGVSLALMKTFRPPWWTALARRGHATLAAGILVTAISLWLFVDRYQSLAGVAAWGAVIGFPLLAIGLGLLVASSISVNGLLARFPIPGARWIATLAFSLYLTHKEVSHLDRLYLPSLTAANGWEAALLYAVTCVAAAGILYACVERPCMALRDRLAGSSENRLQQELLRDPAL